MNVSEPLSAGLKAATDGVSSFAHTQAAWRFYANEAVSLPILQAPLTVAAREGIEAYCQDYALCIHDWSHVVYRHQNKPDRYALTHQADSGYDLQSSLVISDRTGQPIAPVAQCLVSATGRQATYEVERIKAEAHLDEVTHAMTHVESLGFSRSLVHLMDREGDSVGHYRHWQAAGLQWLVRIRDNPTLEWQQHRQVSQRIAEQLTYSPCGTVLIQGKPHVQWVAETRVRVVRPAQSNRAQGSKSSRAGSPVDARLVVSRVFNTEGKRIAQWLLLTNVLTPPAATIALWYDWRWQIESFFKLLKSAGHQLEAWQQESALAIAKRLLVTSMACVTVWQIAASTTPQVVHLRQFLVRLSGRQMKHNVDFTTPALLAGLEVFLAFLALTQTYSADDLQTLSATLHHFLPKDV